MSILIEKVRIKNFRVLKDIEISLKPITLLVGANNSGKTTLLKALNSVLGITKNQINKDDLFEGSNSNSDEIIIDIKIIPVNEQGERIKEFDDKWTSKLGVDVFFENDYNVFAFRTIYKFGIEDSPNVSYYLFNDWAKEGLQPDEYKKMSQVRNNIKMYFIDAQRDILDDSKQRSSFFGKLVSQLDYGNELDNLKEQIKELNDNAIDKSDVLKHLKTELSKLNSTTQNKGEGVSLNPFPKKIGDLHKGMKVYFQDNESESFSIDNHGMGTRSWASIITAGAFSSWELQQIENKIKEGIDTDLLFPIFALEEPEAHLHPNAQRTIYKQIKSFKGQKIISTHSPYIAGQAELDELRHFFKEGNSSIINEIDFDKLNKNDIQRIKDNVISSKGEVLFSNIVVMSEGETEEFLLPLFARKYFNKADFELGISFIATGKHYSLLSLLRFLKIEWFIFSDYDKEDVKSALNSVLKHNNILSSDNVIKLNDDVSKKDIEEYLFDEGYEIELKNAIKVLVEPEYNNEQHKKAKAKELSEEHKKIDNYTKEEVLKKIRDYKVKASKIYGELIIERENESCIPSKIRELFDKISEKLNIPKNE